MNSIGYQIGWKKSGNITDPESLREFWKRVGANQMEIRIEKHVRKKLNVRVAKWLWIVILGESLNACAISPQKKGTLTVADIGARNLTEKGDVLMDTGVYAKKNVSPEFAEGYEKGLSDAAKRDYWSLQDRQRWIH